MHQKNYDKEYLAKHYQEWQLDDAVMHIEPNKNGLSSRQENIVIALLAVALILAVCLSL